MNTTNKIILDSADPQEEERKDNKQIEDRENIYLKEVKDKMLNFEDIQEITNKTNINQRPKREPKEIHVLTEQEENSLNTWIKDIEKYIVQYAMEGKNKFYYDCSKVKTALFYELARKFKQDNQKFYVEYQTGPQLLLVSWEGKR